MKTKKKKSNFELEAKKIITTYNPLLVEIENFPNLDDKKIVRTESFKDLINVKKMMNRPIYYVKNRKSYNFVLFDKKDAYVYLLKDDRPTKFLFSESDSIELLD